MTRPRLLLPLAPLALLAACGEDPSQTLARATGEMAAHDDRAARIDLISVLRSRPDDHTVLKSLARVQLRLGDGEGAAATLDRLAAVGAKGPELIRLRAEAEYRRGQLDKALRLLAADTGADAWRIRAAVAVARQDEPAALAAYQAGMKAGANLALTVDHARFLIAAEDYVGAERLLAEANHLAPGDYETLLLAADLRARQGRADEARRAYAKAAKVAPRRVEPLLGQAELADMAGQTGDVERLVKAAAALSADDPRVGQWQIQIAQMKGDWQAVRTALAPREATLDPVSAEGLAYAEALLRLGAPEQARALFRRAQSLSPQNPYARLMLAEAELATGDARTAFATIRPLAEGPRAGDRELDLAERAARQANLPEAALIARMRASPQAAAARRLAAQAQAAYAREDWPAAAAAYDSLSGMGRDPDVLRLLALSSSRAGQHDAAISAADRALALSPDNPDMQFAAGLVRLNARRDLARALDLLKSATAADPRNALFRTTLAKAKNARTG